MMDDKRLLGVLYIRAARLEKSLTCFHREKQVTPKGKESSEHWTAYLPHGTLQVRKCQPKREKDGMEFDLGRSPVL